MLVFSNPGGVGNVSTNQLTYIPEYLEFTTADQLTSIEVVSAGDGTICKLDSAGINALGRIRKIGNVTNRYSIPLANGLIVGKNVTVTTTTSAVGAIDFFAYSRQPGQVIVQTMMQEVLANSGFNFTDFFYWASPSAGATDEFNVTFTSGTTQKFQRSEFQSMLSFTQLATNSGSDYAIDNLARVISMLNYIPAAQRTVYLARFTGARGVINNQV